RRGHELPRVVVESGYISCGMRQHLDRNSSPPEGHDFALNEGFAENRKGMVVIRDTPLGHRWPCVPSWEESQRPPREVRQCRAVAGGCGWHPHLPRQKDADAADDRTPALPHTAQQARHSLIREPVQIKMRLRQKLHLIVSYKLSADLVHLQPESEGL